MRDDEPSACVREEDTISYEELDFYLDAKRRLFQAHLRLDHRDRRTRPLLFTDLDHFFDDQDAMMA